ncbi:MAG: Clp protease N-terminal domain-containing protein, partial [bacterium]
MLALLEQPEGSTRSLLARAGANTNKLSQEARQSLDRLPKVSQATGEIHVGSELGRLLNLTDREAQKRGDQFVASEHFLLVLAEDKCEAGKLLRESGV